MGIERIAVLNEPVVARRGDRLPKTAPAASARVNRVIRARLELERELRVCGNGPLDAELRLTQAHIQVLLAMLSEVDSPMSASLRARAAGVMGALKLEQAAPMLRKIAMDDGEDLQTRLNAILSYVELRQDGAAADVTKLLKSKDRLVRTATYVAALRSGNARLTSLAESSFEEEVDRSVRRHVALRVPRLLPSQTREDS